MSWNQTRSRQFDAPVIEYLDRLYSYARILVRNLAEAENLVHETCLRANESMDRLQASDGKRWLFTVLRDIWLRRQRDPQLNESRDHNDPGNDIVAPSATSLDPSVCQSETEHLRVALQRLPTELREIVFFREYEGFSSQEIAAILNCPVETVTPQLVRARGKLRTALAAWNPPISPQGKRREGSGASSLFFFSRTELARRTVN
jgi:RNA polymerase sigma-70 factor (ECF subfamily)